MRATRLLVALFALSLAGCIQSGGGSGNGNGNNGNNGNGNGDNAGERLAGNLFGGGASNNSGPQDNTTGGDGEGGEEGGGDIQVDPEGGGGDVGSAVCAEVCADIIDCVESVCGLDVTEGDRSGAISECTAACASEASTDEVETVQRLTADNCALLREESGGFCDELEDDGSTNTNNGSSGGTGTVTPNPTTDADCDTLCARGGECCREASDDPDECADFDAECGQFCHALPAAGVACVIENIELSCDDITAACEEFLDQGGVTVDTEDPVPPDQDDAPGEPDAPAPPPDE